MKVSSITIRNETHLMRYRLLGLSMSFLIHGGILLIVLLINQSLPDKSKIVTLDLSILEPEVIENTGIAPATGLNDAPPVKPEISLQPLEKVVENHTTKPIQKRIATHPAKSSTKASMNRKSTSSPLCSPASNKALSCGSTESKASVQTQDEQGPGHINPYTENSTNEGVSAEAAQSDAVINYGADKEGPGLAVTGKEQEGRKTYLEVNYESIRNRLRESLIYPKIARKSGWAGEVIVSFVILPNGAVSDIRIKKSCGIAVLDGSAVQTIEKACPFPAPPTVERIAIPIAFQLQ